MEETTFFDIDRLLSSLNLPEKELDLLKKTIRDEFPNDDMLYELHLLRALKSFKKKKEIKKSS